MTSCLRLDKSYLSSLLESIPQKSNFNPLQGSLTLIYSGRVYLRRIIDELNRLKADNHKAILCGSIKQISLGGRISWLLSMENQCSLIKFLLSLFSLIVVTWQQGASLMVTGFTAAGNVTGPWCQNYI